MAAKKSKTSMPDRKTEALSIRIDPRLKYGLELLSRHQRRAVTGVVEWALSEAFSNEQLPDAKGNMYSLSQVLPALWSENEIERFLALYFHFPTLMTYEESRFVNVLVRTENLWLKFDPSKENNFRLTEVLKHWESFAPILAEAAERQPQVGLSDEDLTEAGLSHLTLPF